MFKCAAVVDAIGLKVAKNILKQIYDEAPQHWPHGLIAEGFDSGLYLVMDKRSNFPSGFVGFQERIERDINRRNIKVGYYSVGILPQFRQNGLAKQAVAKLISLKAANVDCVKAMIVSDNVPSLALAKSLDIPVRIKSAALLPGMLTSIALLPEVS
jgi:Acetyltransferase (GNAT) family